MLNALAQLTRRNFERSAIPKHRPPHRPVRRWAFRHADQRPRLVDLRSETAAHARIVPAPASTSPAPSPTAPFKRAGYRARRPRRADPHRGWTSTTNRPVALGNHVEDTVRRPAPSCKTERTRHARRHPRHLGRRVRPNRLLAGHADARSNYAATITRAISACGSPAAAQGVSPTVNRRLQLQHSSTSRAICSICTQPVLKCLGIDH